jgi:exopolysaccharide biosynthesis polyprenyl glycosylphosphotransferase
VTTTETTADSAATGPAPTTARHYGETGNGLPGDTFVDRWVWEAHYVRLLLAVDFFATLLATLAAFVIRFQGAHYARWYLVLSALIPAIWLGVLAMSRAYERRLLFVGTDEYQRVIRAGVRLTLGMALGSYVLNASLARGYLLLVLVGTTVLSLLGRFVLRRLLHRGRRQGVYMRRVLVLGHANAVAEVTRQLHRRYYHGLKVIGACLPPAQLTAAADVVDVPIFGTIAAAANSAAAAGADTVMVLSCPELDGPVLRRLAWELERDDIDLMVSASLVDTAGDRITVRPVDGLPMMHIEHPHLSGGRRLVKSVFDTSVAALLLLLAAPVFAVVALLIRLDSDGPILFRQTRVGKNGEAFSIVKFRTMYTDAEQRLDGVRQQNEHAGVLFKIRQDPRITRCGRFLRRYSLDELPQLINVVLGDMSLVGPRPPLPAEVAHYPHDMRRRLVVKPGMTGLWQVSGRADLSWEDSIRLDLRYVENWSLTVDLVILMRTAMAVMRGSGAY